MNGRMTYRPHYEFGRIYLTDNEREYISESATFTLLGQQLTDEEINDM